MTKVVTPSVLASARNRGEAVAVIVGGDAHRAHRAKASADAISEGLSGLGYRPIAVELGSGAEADLLASGARLAMNAALHSRLDDGGVPELCDSLGILCVGAGEIAYRNTTDKAICSGLLAGAGIATPRQKVVSRGHTYTLGFRAALPRIATQLGPRVVVKPRCGGANGIGVRTVNEVELLPAAINSAFKDDSAVVVESAISGREYMVLISGSTGDLWAVGVAEVLHAELADSGSIVRVRSYKPVFGIAERRLQAAIETARRAADVVGCKGLASVDLIIDEHGTEWVIGIDCAVDWAPGGYLSACLATNDVSENELLASLLTEAASTARQAA